MKASAKAGRSRDVTLFQTDFERPTTIGSEAKKRTAFGIFDPFLSHYIKYIHVWALDRKGCGGHKMHHAAGFGSQVPISYATADRMSAMPLLFPSLRSNGL